MASNLRVDSIVPATGANVSIGTATGGVNIPGVLTYEDVTNVDSVGVITARSGIRIGATGANTLITGNTAGIGIGTANPQCILDISKDVSGGVNSVDIRNHHPTGGASLRVKTQGTYGSPTYQAILGASDAGGTIRVGAVSNHPLLLLTNNTERLRIAESGQLGIGGANYGSSGQVLTSQGSGSAVQWATPGLIYEGSATSFPTDAGEVNVDVILSTAKRIEIFVLGFSVNSSGGEFVLRLRTASGTLSSNVYKGSGHYLSNTNYASSTQNTTSFQSYGLGTASAAYSGHLVLKNYNAHYWFLDGDFWNDAAATGYWMSGHVNAGAQITGVVLRNASGSFDAGEYRIRQYNTP